MRWQTVALACMMSGLPRALGAQDSSPCGTLYDEVPALRDWFTSDSLTLLRTNLGVEQSPQDASVAALTDEATCLRVQEAIVAELRRSSIDKAFGTKGYAYRLYAVGPHYVATIANAEIIKVFGKDAELLVVLRGSDLAYVGMGPPYALAAQGANACGTRSFEDDLPDLRRWFSGDSGADLRGRLHIKRVPPKAPITALTEQATCLRVQKVLIERLREIKAYASTGYEYGLFSVGPYYVAAVNNTMGGPVWVLGADVFYIFRRSDLAYLNLFLVP